MNDPQKDLDTVVRDILATFDRNSNKRIMRALAAEAIRIIKARTRSGQGVKKMGGRTYTFPKLKKSYIERRKRMRLSAFTSPEKSNVTATGRLLNSLRTTQEKDGSVGIEAAGNRPEGLSNSELVEYLELKNRLFMNLSAGEIQQLYEYYQRNLLTL